MRGPRLTVARAPRRGSATGVRRSIVLGFAVVPLLSPAPGERISFAPPEGSRASKTFAFTADFVLDDLGIVVGGQDVGAQLGGLDFSLRTEQEVEVTDEYVASEEGRPLELLRTFHALEGLLTLSFVSEFGTEDEDLTLSSELEGRTVRFVWNAEDGEYERSFEDSESDGDLLADLEEDMDFRALLPDGEVEAGDTWEVAIERLRSVASPGGELAFVPEDAEVEDTAALEDLFEERFSQLGDELDGDCVCTFAGLREGEPSLAEIEVEVEVDTSLDLSELLLEAVDAIAEENGEEAPELEIDVAAVSLEVESAGVLLWNADEDRLHSFEASGDAVVSLDFSVSVETEDGTMDVELFAELSGFLEQTATAEE